MSQQQTVYDVAIIGSGAGGGMAAYALTKAGAKVVMLEAGGPWYASKNTQMLTPSYASPRRGASTKTRPFGEFDACDGGWDIEGEPYTRAPGTRFDWWRARMLGGRTNHWGRISLRFGPDDFKGKTKDGLWQDWPIAYEDVAPYYDRVDDLVGVFGSREGLRNHPDGNCLPPRLSIITQKHNGRQACHFCGQCNRGCRTNSNFSSPEVLIRPAMKTGRLRLVTNAMAREVTVGDDGLATGVTYIDKRTGEDVQVRARTVV